MKKLQQFVEVTPAALDRGEVEVTSWFDHATLGDVLTGRWEMRADDRRAPIASGEMPALDLAPRASRKVTLPLPAITPEPGVDYWLNISYSLAKATNWARAGEELAWSQMKLAAAKAGDEAGGGGARRRDDVEHGRGDRSTAGDTKVTVDKASGLIRSLQFKGKELLASPVAPHFWRAPSTTTAATRCRRRAPYGATRRRR